jgi:hypothetical protein
MMRDEKPIRDAARRLAEESLRLQEQRLRLKGAGFTQEEIQRVIDPLESFYLQKKEELESDSGPPMT